ncbi:uncharacterized protein LOC123003782 isoform X1 [Tribolium madens]|uniref:uncharacterized protein LOC123003782 isoform X1 n=2 Tax=Tribolium madens TaxID=41895 RepID=UPI001CF74446|nr:uncharacterized protein LOC123003782 isoform X1 [Tribolium madens]
MKHNFCYVIFTLITPVLSKKCDNLGILLYEDMGCSPHYEESNPCPTRYACHGLESSEKHCFYKSKIYEIGEIVDNQISNGSCYQSCRCTKEKESANFHCAILDCDEWLDSPIGHGCYRQYSLDDCCASGQSCPPYNNVAKCIIDGKEYKEGERFYPEKTCLRCICQKGFKGKLEEPFCKRKTCDVQLEKSVQDFYQACAPLYGPKGEVLCCPFGWICPDGSENIQGRNKTDNTCKFGKKYLKIGDSVEKLNVKNGFGEIIKKIVCECVVPPLLTCNVVLSSSHN